MDETPHREVPSGIEGGEKEQADVSDEQKPI
jgi:hypothetical protein